VAKSDWSDDAALAARIITLREAVRRDPIEAGGKRVENVDDVASIGQKILVEIAENRLARQVVAGGCRRQRVEGRRSRRVMVRKQSLKAGGTLPSARLQPVGSTKVLLRESDGGVVKRTVLAGGLRIISEQVPNARSASVGIWAGVGSRDETPQMAGSAHFLEHLLFKGTPTRSAKAVSNCRISITR